jgi:hypothetical protein
MRLAVYKNGASVTTVDERRLAYVGSVGAGFNVENLMQGIFDSTAAQYMRVQLADIGPISSDVAPASGNSAERLLFSSVSSGDLKGVFTESSG